MNNRTPYRPSLSKRSSGCSGSKSRFQVHAALCSLFLAAAAPLQASNLLVNPSWENGKGSWTQYGVFDLNSTNDKYYNGGNANTADNVNVYDGGEVGKSYGQFTGAVNYNGVYQDVLAVPTSVYTADCWLYSSSQDHIGGANTSWVEVQFRDSNGSTLALYRSGTFTSNSVACPEDTWTDYQVTNQLDPVTFATTNTVQNLVAPPGTATVRFQLVFRQDTDNAGGSVYYDLADLNLVSGPVPPTISGVYPDGSVLMQGITNALTFNVTSPSSITNIQLILNGNDVTSGLVITGTDTNKQVSYPFLKTNLMTSLPATGGGEPYTAVITVKNNLGAAATVTKSFDTYDPNNFTFEAEDYDFTTDFVTGGNFFDNPALPSTSNPATNSYYGLYGLPSCDYSDLNGDGNHAYRPYDTAGTEPTSDLLRQKYIDARKTDSTIADYDVGWWDAQDFENYTRTYPTGIFNVVARLSSPGATVETFSMVTNGWGTTNQQMKTIGTFNLSSGLGWSTYSWVPLTDADGNIVKLTLGGTNTFRVTSGGNANAQFFMLVAANTNLPTITGIYPNGATLMEHTNTLSFTANSTVGINASDVSVTLSMRTITSSSTNTYTTANGLTVTGPATAEQFSYSGLVDNALYSATIQVKDSSGNSASSTVNFDTYNPSFTWEAEDWDYNGGQHIQPTPVDAYANLTGMNGIDFLDLANGGNLTYRPGDTMDADPAGDTARTQYLAASKPDYSLGYFSIVGGTNEWVNYTRNFPSNNYNIYARVAVGGGTSGLSLSKVTNGWGTAQQDVQTFGYLTVANTGGWGTYAYAPFRDASSNILAVTLSGTNTLRLTRTSGGDANVNFLMLLPAQKAIGGVTLGAAPGLDGKSINLTFDTQTGLTYTVYYKDDLANAAWTQLGSSVAGDGSTHSVSDSTSGSHRYYRLMVQ